MPRKRTFTIDAALDGAMELFSERSYHGTSMPAIAEHLKLSRSCVYYTFRAKSALFEQALRRYTGAGRAPGLSELSCFLSESWVKRPPAGVVSRCAPSP